MTRNDDITVTVTPAGRVTVNGALVAEVSVGIVDGRDQLVHDLALHRISGHILRTVNDAATYLATLKTKDKEAAALGMADGLLDVTIPHSFPNVPNMPPRSDREYSAGYQIGVRLRVMRNHLAAEVGP